MGKNDRRNKYNRKNWNNQIQNNQPAMNSQEQSKFNKSHSRFIAENFQDNQIREAAIQEFKSRTVICSKCGKQIPDMTNAISDSEGKPMHFDCVIEKITSSEKIKDDEKITYIGQGRFGIVHFENPQDLRHFEIRRIIEWETREEKKEWRQEIADSFSSIK